MFRFSSRQAFKLAAIVLAAMGWPSPCLQAGDAENLRPAASPEDFKQRRAALVVKTDEIEKEVSALKRELTARCEEIDKDAEIQILRKQATETREAAAAFLKTNATLIGLRQARDKALAEVEVARHQILEASAEAQVLYPQRTDVEIKETVLAFKIREADFVMERQVLPRLYRDHEDLAAARTRKETLGRQIRQARTDAEKGSKELMGLRAEVNQARAASEAARPALSNDLTKARTEKEAALRALAAETLKDEEKAVTDARNQAAKIRAEVTARDPEAVALNGKVVELNKQRADLKKTRDDTQASLRELRAKVPKQPDKAGTGAGNPAAPVSTHTADGAQALAALTGKIAELDKQREDLDYQISLTEFRLREGVGRRIGCDPEVRKAEAAVKNAEKARRAKEADSSALAAARADLDALRLKMGELETAANATPEGTAARAERAAKEKALNDLRAKLTAEAVAGLNPPFEEATQAEEALRAKKVAEDAEAKDLGRGKEEATQERAAVTVRRQALESELRKLYDKTADLESIKTFSAAADAASKAYDAAYATSEIQKLLEAQAQAAESLAKKTTALRNADERCSALSTKMAGLKEKGYAINAEIKELER